MALDIGGANLKIADGHALGVSQPFALWQNPAQLSDALRALIALVPRVDHIAVTMTGELADCFTTKAEGVRFILDAVLTAADGRHTRVYLTNGKLVSLQTALRQPLLAAASNWHALASFAGRYVPEGNGLLIDIGSTTCDFIPLVDGAPVTIGKTDTNRMVNGELIYTGIVRSPVCAVAPLVPWRGRKCPTAQEVFATMWDVYIILGELPEEPNNTNTADNRPATKAAARDRLARQICADREIFNETDARLVSEAISQNQIRRIGAIATQLIARLQQPPHTIVISGRGEFLARRLLEKMKLKSMVISLARELGPELSHCAPAHALAVLAREGSR
ncbi:MAG TPA: hydantoinase/oxoprolinase family protein [Pirellulales bacterium]|nr:hydantoinase/oxoprolinase family protein [Pirellulales bacterium]